MRRMRTPPVADVFHLKEDDLAIVSVAEAIRRGGLPVRMPQQRQADLQSVRAGKSLLGLLTRSSGAASLTRAARYVPEAVVKFVPRGGVNTPVELKAQLAYIGRLGQDREVGLQHSLGFEGEVMSRDEIAALIEDWSQSWRGMSDYGQTRHMIVSFPEDFDPARAEDAARAAVDRAFSSGDYGDVWEFVSAFHSGDDETPNPHLHVVVQSRGMENGLWMDTRMHAALSPDTLRRLIAEEAREIGLELNATARFERGYPTRGRSSADSWRERKGVEPVGRAEDRKALTPVRKIAIAYAETAYRTLGALVSNTCQRTGDALNTAADNAGSGMPGGGGPVILQSPEATATLNDIIELGESTAANLEQSRANLARIENPAARVGVERQIAAVQAEASHFLADRPEYLAYEIASPDTFYALEPDEEAALEARRIGLDPEELALRSGVEPSLAQVADWQARDVAAVLKAHGHSKETAPESLIAEAREAIGEIYRENAARTIQSTVDLDREAHAQDDARTSKRREQTRGRDDDDGHSI